MCAFLFIDCSIFPIFKKMKIMSTDQEMKAVTEHHDSTETKLWKIQRK